MTVVYKLNGATVPSKNVFLHWGDEEGFEGAAAADGTGSFGSVTFHDPDGTLDVQGWMSFTVDETDCTTAPRLVTSWIYVRDYARGSDELTSAARTITCQLLDPNAMLSFPLISGQDGNRGAETDADTITWLLSTYLDGLVQDLGLVNPPPRDFDAANYIGRKPADVLNDLCSPRGQIFFAYWSQTDNAIGLFYDDPTATAFTSTLTISNVASDVSSTCFPPWQDEKLNKDPSEVYDLIRYSKKGGSIVRTDAATTAAFFSAFSQHRGVQVTNDRVGLRATAITFATRLLGFYSTERDTFTVTIRVPSTQVGLIDAGMRVGVRFSHLSLEGYGSLTYVRVERRTFKQAEGRRGFYDVTLTMSNHGLGTSIGSGGGTTDPFPVTPPPSDVSYVQEKGANTHTVVLDNAPTDGHLLTWFVTSRNVNITATTPTGWTLLDYTYDGTGISSRYAAVYYKTALSTISTFQWLGSPAGFAMHVFEWADGVTIDTAAGSFGSIRGASAPGDLSSVSVTPTAIATLVGNLLVGSNDINPIDVVPGSGTTQIYYSTATGFSPRNWVGTKTGQTGASSVAAALTGTNGYGGITYAVYNGDAAAPDPPTSGSPIPPGVATITPATDGSTTAFTVVDSTGTTIAFAEGSLHVEMNGVELAPGRDFTETSGPSGTFAFTRAPSSVAEIVLWMQAA